MSNKTGLAIAFNALEFFNPALMAAGFKIGSKENPYYLLSLARTIPSQAEQIGIIMLA